jgi:hypothetical protein
LKKEIISGTYSMKMDDIFFLAKTPKPQSYAGAVKSSSQNSKQKMEKNIENNVKNETNEFKLETLKKLGAKKRYPEQQKEYNRQAGAELCQA